MNKLSNKKKAFLPIKPSTIALLLGVLSILGSLYIGNKFFETSVNDLEQQYQKFYLRESKIFMQAVSLHESTNDNVILDDIENIWNSIEGKNPDEYICIVDKNSKLIMHTAHPNTIGNFAGKNLIFGGPDIKETCLEDLVKSKRDYVGDYISSSGQNQLAAFSSVLDKNWVIGVHRSKQALIDDIEERLRSSKIGFFLISGVLIPLSWGLLFIIFLISERNRKKIEADLLKSEERFQLAVNATQDGIYDWDLVSNAIYYSPGWKSMLGYKEDELPNDFSVWQELTLPEDTQRAWEMQNDLINKKRNRFEMEFKMKHKSGHWVDILSRATANFDHNGKAVRIVGTHVDVSERKRIEEDIRKRESRYRTILRTAIDGFWITDINGHFLEVNEAYSQMSGYSQDELLNMHIADIEANEKPEKIKEHIKKGMAIRYERFESLHRRKDNSTYPVEVNFTYSDKEGGKFIVFVKDIAERKRTEDNLLKNQYYLTKAQEIGKIGTWELDIQKKILIWTDENYKIFGVPLGTKLNYEIFLNCIHPDDRGYVDKKWNEALKNKSYDIMHRLVVDNKIKWVREKADIEFDSKGKPIIAIGFTQDLTGLKEIENALQESEKKFKTMFERAPLSYQSLDENGNFTEVNQTWLKTMGYTRDEVLGENFSEFLVPEWKNHFKENFPRFKAVGEILGVEFEMVKKDGSRILVSFHGKIGIDELGNFKQTHCIFQDITTNKMIQKESEKNKTILLEAEKMAGFGGWQWDIKGDSWTMSQNWLNIHGCSISNIATDELIKIAHPDDRLKIQKSLNKIVKDGGIYDNEYRIVHQKTGEIKYIHSYGETRLDDTGKTVQVFGAAQDITDKKQAEESSKRLKERLESLWNVTKIADSDIKTISDHVLAEVQKMTQSQYAFYGFLDKNENEMILHAWSHETMNDCETDAKTLHFAVDKAGIWAEAIKEKKALIINNFHLDHPGKKGVPDGHVQLTRLMVVPYIKEDQVISIVAVANKSVEYSEEDEKQVQAFMGNVQLLIDRKTAQQDKIDLLTQLRHAQKMESIGTLAGGIAHDFNNILFPIVGYSEMLLEDTPEDSPTRNNLNQIYTSALRAKSLVKQILTFSRQESSELMLMKMQPIVMEALKLIRSTIPTTIEIKQDINPDCGVIKADPTQIHQIVMNLSTNAYHAMEETGGELKVRLKEIKLGEYDILRPDMKPGIYACLTIADTGRGMDKELTQKIFDPFFTTKEKGKGTGLGLSVVHGIVTSMNGVIQVYSEPGEGTQFHVYLPVEKNFSEEQVIHSKIEIQGGTEQILLVDDEEAIISMEKRMLERLGYKVTSRFSSLEALEAFRANPDKFDIVITDMAMPNMPGDKLSAELTKIRPGIPVLLCTGFSENMSEEKAASLGIKGFLWKPIVMKDLAQKIREVLDKK